MKEPFLIFAKSKLIQKTILCFHFKFCKQCWPISLNNAFFMFTNLSYVQRAACQWSYNGIVHFSLVYGCWCQSFPISFHQECFLNRWTITGRFGLLAIIGVYCTCAIYKKNLKLPSFLALWLMVNNLTVFCIIHVYSV